MTRRFLLSLAIPFLIAASFLSGAAAQQAQTTVPAAQSILPGPKPPDAPADWKRLVGIYQGQFGSLYIIELDRDLRWIAPRWKYLMLQDENGTFWVSVTEGPRIDVIVKRNVSGDISEITFDEGLVTNSAVWTPGRKVLVSYARTDAGSDPARFYRVTPAQPVGQLREKALKLSPPVERGLFRTPDLVELVSLDPAIHLDIRYASANNFLSTPVYTEARAFMQRPAAEALLRVLDKLQPLGYGLLIHDAYRPWYVTKIFWDATPPEGKIFVADPQKGSKHNRGCAVDLTLYDLVTGQSVEMPGLYDEMSPRSFPNFPGGTSLQRWHRDLLRRAMESEGFTVNEDEWWHFDYKDWKRYGILNVPFEKLRISQQPTAVSH
ncbi:MAG TPA: M15 family metallopeptidase [Candidatus Acidoferrales bacterium]|nr:M15 family metallopeptidase [Candidatus Acidoferrales bacterium]